MTPPMWSSKWGKWWPPVGLFLLAALVRAGSLAGQGFDGLYGQDPFAYYGYAVGPLRSALLSFQPWPPFFWPPGFPLLMTLGSLLFGASPLVGQWISLLAGSLVTVFTYALAREVCLDLQDISTASLPPSLKVEDARALRGSKIPAFFAGKRGAGGVRSSLTWVPIVAGLVTVFHPQLWQSSIVVMSDTVSLAAGTLGGWALARYARLNRTRWLALSAAALAYAMATRWAYALEAVPCATYGVYLLVSRTKGRRTETARGAAGAAVSGGAVLAALLGPGLLGRSGPDAATYTGDLEVYSWSPLNFFRRKFATIDGLLSYRLPNGLYYALSPGHPDYFTPLLAVLLAPGLWLVLRSRRSLPLVLLLGWPAMVLGFHAGAPWQNFRFTLAALPPLAVMVALGAAQAVAWLGPRRGWIVYGLVVAGLAWQLWAGWQLTQQFIVRKRAELAVVSAVEAQAPANAQLLTFSITAMFDFYGRLDTHELWGLDTNQVAGLVADGRPTLLLLDVANIEAQWQGHAPANDYHWLRDGPGLDQLGQYQNYTLFRVR
jgi:hypothetical protein